MIKSPFVEVADVPVWILGRLHRYNRRRKDELYTLADELQHVKQKIKTQISIQKDYKIQSIILAVKHNFFLRKLYYSDRNKLHQISCPELIKLEVNCIPTSALQLLGL